VKIFVSAVVAAALLGALEALSVGVKLHVSQLAFGTLIGMGLALPIGVAVGSGALALGLGVRRFLVPQRLWVWLKKRIPSGLGARLERSFELVLPLVLFVLPVSYGALRIGFSALQVLQDANLALELSVLISLAVLTLGVVMSGALFSAVSNEGAPRRVFLRLSPGRAVTRLALVFWLPAAFLVAPLVHLFRDELGEVADFGVWVCFLLTWRAPASGALAQVLLRCTGRPTRGPRVRRQFGDLRRRPASRTATRRVSADWPRRNLGRGAVGLGPRRELIAACRRRLRAARPKSRTCRAGRAEKWYR
jgi:hypothetical protein